MIFSYSCTITLAYILNFTKRIIIESVVDLSKSTLLCMFARKRHVKYNG